MNKRTKVKIYMLMGGEPYGGDYCFGVYSNRENAEKSLKRRQNRQFYDSLSDDWQDDMIYWIETYEVKDLLDEI